MAKVIKMRGLSKNILAVVETQLSKGAKFTAQQIRPYLPLEMQKATDYAIGNTLCYLAAQGRIRREATGVYGHINGGATKTVDYEKVAIDNLLDAMAKAEPVLHRCKRLLEALESVK